MGSDSETEKAIKEKKKLMFLAQIAEPLTGKKQCKRTHKLVRRAKDSVRLLDKIKKRKKKENIASDESIGVYKSPSEFRKRPTTWEGNDDERLLVKAKKRKTKMNRNLDESIGACKSPEFEKGPKTLKVGKDGERLFVKSKKKKIKEKRTSDELIGACESPSEFEKGLKIQKGRRSAKVDSWKSSIHIETLNEIDRFIESEVAANESKTKTRKLKKDFKHKKKHLKNVKESSIEEVQRVADEEKIDEMSSIDDCTKGMKRKLKKDSKHRKKHLRNVKDSSIEEVQRVVDEEKIDEISSVDDDCTRGMKKWLTQYKESRPGLEVLQQRIDEFVTAHEERLEQERKESEARATEDGWTVVVHQKGRKKTTDTETGTAVGSVASAAVMDKMSKKKSKEIALDFYRFQKREAKRNEVMMLQSKFEQDKKRIQQLRAARKFRPS